MKDQIQKISQNVYELLARRQKVDKLVALFEEYVFPADLAEIMDPVGWNKVARCAGLRKPPGVITRAAVIAELRERETRRKA